MTTPLATALQQLRDAVPANPDDHGPIAVPSDAVRSALTAFAVLSQRCDDIDLDFMTAQNAVWAELEQWVNTAPAGTVNE